MTPNEDDVIRTLARPKPVLVDPARVWVLLCTMQADSPKRPPAMWLRCVRSGGWPVGQAHQYESGGAAMKLGVNASGEPLSGIGTTR